MATNDIFLSDFLIFMEECCERVSPTDCISFSEFEKVYMDWCRENRVRYILLSSELRVAIEKFGAPIERRRIDGKQVRVVAGLRFKPEPVFAEEEDNLLPVEEFGKTMDLVAAIRDLADDPRFAYLKESGRFNATVRVALDLIPLLEKDDEPVFMRSWPRRAKKEKEAA